MNFQKDVMEKLKKLFSTRMGFEPTRAEHIGLAVQRLNHSATSSLNVPGRYRNFSTQMESFTR